MLESNNFLYNIEANTLEEAFISLGEEKSHASNSDEVELREKVYEKLFAFKFYPTLFRIFLSLIFRRIALFFNSLVQVMQFVYLIILPPLVLYTFGPDALSTLWLYGLTLAIMFFYFFICSFYANLPFYERKYRMRYLLKMLGTDSVTYYVNMVLTDLFFSTSLILLTGGFYIFLYWGNYDFSDMNNKETLTLFLGFLCWNFSFITQSYFF